MAACRRAAWAGCTKSPPVTSSRTLILLGDGHAPTEPLPPRERIEPGGSEDSGPPGFFFLAPGGSSLPFPKEQTPTVALPAPPPAQWAFLKMGNSRRAPWLLPRGACAAFPPGGRCLPTLPTAGRPPGSTANQHRESDPLPPRGLPCAAARLRL